MEDAVSRSSVESSSTNDDYVVVNGEPKLKITGDINDLNDEVSQSSKKMTSTLTPSSSLGADPQSPISSVDNVFPSSQSTGAIGEDPVSGDSKGRSMSLPGVTDEGYTTFNGVTYLAVPW